MNYEEISGSGGMWAACSLVVILVIFQATIFIVKARKTAVTLGLASADLRTGLKIAAISSIGPSCAVGLAMLSLMVSLGAPFAWMRLSVIGSVPYELFAADSAAKAVGTEIGTASFGIDAYVNIVWTCTLGATGWLLVVMLFAHRFNDIRNYVVRGRADLLPILSGCAMIGAVAYFSAPQVTKSVTHAVAYMVSGLCLLVLNLIGNKLKMAWVSDWSFGVAIFVGMFCTLI
ncbi:DUF5058 family protein [Marinobacterium rhizophilum]|uniref:DUF5058 family protein n=1 Tax=Marinobacterium rhizophilum TaxID=420402 RepID=A0ABY5HRB9_9GAMM|nr:DUF5058 family protein [Marinobacterium rhizophilum]UTW13461.1 DUF5058 family protein [Marinobacterium rhizophilum]